MNPQEFPILDDEFICCWIPSFEPSEERMTALARIIEQETYFPEFEDTLESWKTYLTDGLEQLVLTSDEVASLGVPGAEYGILITGGMTNGGLGLIEVMNDLTACQGMFKTMEEFAKQDAKAKGKPRMSPAVKALVESLREAFDRSTVDDELWQELDDIDDAQRIDVSFTAGDLRRIRDAMKPFTTAASE